MTCLAEHGSGFLEVFMCISMMVQTAQLILGDLQCEADQATWHIIIPIITITSETSHDLKPDSEGTTGRDKSAPIPASKIFSLLDRESTLFPVLSMLRADGSLFSTNKNI